ncbi:MAG: ABC transporter substrate-binding protein [Firmicutes bacterium]|nr:ABC transporter substrate-binding protein [Bacillota bacterium]
MKQIENQTNKKMALFASDDPDGRGWYQAFGGFMLKAGWDAYKHSQEFGLAPLDTTDFTPLIREWMAAGCDTLWANCPANFFGIMWRQANTLGFKPKLVFASRAALFYQDIKAWGGDLPNGITCETWWGPWVTDAKGIGDTTPQSLIDRWTKASGEPVHAMLGLDYAYIQVIADAIERAGKLDSDAVVDALEKTDMMGVYGRIRFNPKNHQIIPSVDPNEGAVGTIFQWQAGKRVVVFPPKIAMGEIKLPPWMKK